MRPNSQERKTEGFGKRPIVRDDALRYSSAEILGAPLTNFQQASSNVGGMCIEEAELAGDERRGPYGGGAGASWERRDIEPHPILLPRHRGMRGLDSARDNVQSSPAGSHSSYHTLHRMRQSHASYGKGSSSEASSSGTMGRARIAKGGSGVARFGCREGRAEPCPRSIGLSFMQWLASLRRDLTKQPQLLLQKQSHRYKPSR